MLNSQLKEWNTIYIFKRMKKQDLNTNEYNDYIAGYINKIDDNLELMKGYEDDKNMIVDFFTAVPKEKLEYRYAEGKWSIKEVFQHIIDTERIFMARLLRIARNDKTALPGYDQDIYIEPSGADAKSLDALLTEFNITRAYSINLLESLSEENLHDMGIVSESPISARACAFLLLGHSIWHIEILKERYL